MFAIVEFSADSDDEEPTTAVVPITWLQDPASESFQLCFWLTG
jgi:hypothetical protein